MARAYAEIPLSGKKGAGRVTLVSIGDYEIATPYRWFLWEQLHKGWNGGPYAITNIINPDGSHTTIQLHTLIARQIAAEEGHEPWKRVDHQNHDGLDNRRSNLRDGRRSNAHNQRPYEGGTSKYKGVSWDSSAGKWAARITFEKRTRRLGRYAEEEAAAHAYNRAAVELFGEYALLNILPD